MNTLPRPLVPNLRGAAIALALPLLTASTAFAVDDGQWFGLLPAAGRYDHFAFYDSSRDRMVVVLGMYNQNLIFNFDVWGVSFGSGPAWQQIRPSGTGLLGSVAGDMVYDSSRDRAIIAPASSSTLTSLDFAGGGAWTGQAISGTPPPATRSGWRGIYDAGADRIVYFGGQEADGTLVNEVWAVNLAGAPTWVQLLPSGTPPPGRSEFSIAYDPAGARLIVVGGVQQGGAPLQDVWALSLGGSPAWVDITPASPGPDARSDATMVLDPLRNRLLLQGGGSYDTTLWALSLVGPPEWNPVATTGAAPGHQVRHTMVYDASRDRLIYYGGLLGDDNSSFPTSYPSSRLRALDLSTGIWTDLSNVRPTPRHDLGAVYDPPRQRMVMFGGFNSNEGLLGDTWALPLFGAGAWMNLTPSGSPPARSDYSAIVDPVRQRMIVFGGYAPGGCSNDTWSLDLAGSAGWSPLVTLGTPPPARVDHAAIYDPAGDRMIVFGGECVSRLNDVWQLTFSATPTWSQLSPSGTPPTPRKRPTAIYDPSSASMLVFGGDGASSQAELWQLSLSGPPTWQLLTPPGTAAKGWGGHSAVYDAARQRMLVFGGGVNGQFNSTSTYALSLGGAMQWSVLSPTGARPPTRCDQSAIFDAEGGRMVIYGGEWCNGILESVEQDNAWALAFSAPTSVPAPTSPDAIALAPPVPNPASGDVTFAFTLPRAANVRLLVYDLAGRSRAEPFSGPLGAGRHEVRWTREARRATGLGPGVYFYELRVETQRASRRMVIVG